MSNVKEKRIKEIINITFIQGGLQFLSFSSLVEFCVDNVL